jgi:hypothetical protein
MSWHGRWGKVDPFAKPAKPGSRFGCFSVVKMAEPDAHYGLRALVKCQCGAESVRVLAQIRWRKPGRCMRCPRQVGA